jgi:hypothetical protein
MIERLAVVTPSDHERKYCFPFAICGDGTLTELADPTMTVLVYGVAAFVPLKVTDRPAGLVWNDSVLVLGCSRTVAEELRPPASVAVRLSSSEDG